MRIKVLAVVTPTSTTTVGRRAGASIGIVVVEAGFVALCRRVAEMPGATELVLPAAHAADLADAMRSLAPPVAAAATDGAADRGVLLFCEAGTPLDDVVDAVFLHVRQRRAERPRLVSDA